MSYHHLSGPVDAHAIHCWVYDTEVKRDAHEPSEGSTEPITEDDVSLHRVCYVKSTQAFYFLVDLLPLTWKALGV